MLLKMPRVRLFPHPLSPWPPHLPSASLAQAQPSPPPSAAPARACAMLPKCSPKVRRISVNFPLFGLMPCLPRALLASVPPFVSSLPPLPRPQPSHAPHPLLSADAFTRAIAD